MSNFTYDNQYAQDASGQASWDVDVNGNFTIAERGYHFQSQAGALINSGDVCLINSAGYVVQFDARSTTNLMPHCISWQQVTSGANATFLNRGIVRSMGVWSGQLIPGQPVFVSAQSPGFVTNSYAGISPSVGVALGSQAIMFMAGGTHRVTPERVTATASVGPVLVGSLADFSVPIAYRGIMRVMSMNVQSCDNWQLSIYTGSARTTGQLAYQTAVQSGSKGATTGITTLSAVDAAMFPWLNSDVSSPVLLFGRFSVLSGSTVSSSNFSIAFDMERFQ